jgi:hypothetical protein
MDAMNALKNRKDFTQAQTSSAFAAQADCSKNAKVHMDAVRAVPGPAHYPRASDQRVAINAAHVAAAQAAFPAMIRDKQPHLIGFYAEQSIESKRMKYLGDLLEEELPGTKIVWLEAWENPLNERLRATIDLRNQCGGVPYLFNRKTGKVLCGIQAYDKLRAWAQGLGGDARIYRDIGSGGN